MLPELADHLIQSTLFAAIDLTATLQEIASHLS